MCCDDSRLDGYLHLVVWYWMLYFFGRGYNGSGGYASHSQSPYVPTVKLTNISMDIGQACWNFNSKIDSPQLHNTLMNCVSQTAPCVSTGCASMLMDWTASAACTNCSIVTPPSTAGHRCKGTQIWNNKTDSAAETAHPFAIESIETLLKEFMSVS